MNPETPETPSDPLAKPIVTRRPRGKIGRLPKLVRDHLNQLIQDGLPYEAIRQQLGEPAKDLTADNISEWKNNGGYQDWINEQFWHEEMRARLETFTAVADTDPSQLSLAGLQMSLTQLCEQLRDIRPGDRSAQFENHADKYLRMLNSFSRLAKTLLAVQEYRDAAAKVAIRELKKQDLGREFSQPERQAWLDRADDFFNIKSAARLRHELESAATGPKPTTNGAH